MKKKKIIRRSILFLILLLHAVVILLPILLTVVNSFMSQREIEISYGAIFSAKSASYISENVDLRMIPSMVSFSQFYTVLFQSPDYLLKFWNSVIFVVPIVIFQVAIALLAAYSFSRFRGKYKEIFLFLYIILMLMPYQVTMVPNYLVSGWLGLLDTRWSIWLPGISAPFSVYLLTKYMRKIPISFYEAAKADGAGEWRIFTAISLPLCRGAICSVSILVFIDYWNMVEQPVLMLSDSSLYPLSVYLSTINESEVGVAFAIAVIYMVLPMLVYLYGEDYLVDGIVYSGGVKY